jgi:parvulin-like peptidyl-prolyl isomerase
VRYLLVKVPLLEVLVSFEEVVEEFPLFFKEQVEVQGLQP